MVSRRPDMAWSMFEVDASQLQKGIEALQVIRSGGPPIITREQAANVLKALARMQIALEAYERTDGAPNA